MKVFVVSNIIIYVLIKSAKGENGCNFSPQSPQQCACISRAKYAPSSCEWQTKKLIYSKKQQEGFVDLRLPNLATCSSEKYTVTLHINENLTTPEICHRNFSKNVVVEDLQWRMHSKITYKIYELQKCPSCRTLNNSIPTAAFDYLFSGCYIMNIYNENEHLYESRPTFISTGYKKILLADDSVITVLQSRFTQNKELEISIRMNSTHFLKPPSIRTLLIEKGCRKNCTELKAVTRVDYVDTSFNKYNRKFIACNTFSNTTQNCTYTKSFHNNTLYICKYTGLKPGSYGFRFALLDEYTRCNDYSLWKVCDWPVSSFSVPEVELKNTTHFDIPMENVNPAYIIVPIISVIIFLCLLVFLRRKYPTFRHGDRAALKPTYGSEENLPLKPREILIVYARDSELFKKMITSFRLLLSSVDDEIFVHDINMDNESMCVDPQTWIMNKISSENLKVILFLNNCGLVFFENQPKVAYRSPNWQDQMFAYAVKQLKHSSSRNYTNLFVVEMAGILYSTYAFDDLNPETRYVMPNNIEKLLKNIFSNAYEYNESFLRNFLDYCGKYNDFCEENPGYVNSILRIG